MATTGMEARSGRWGGGKALVRVLMVTTALTAADLAGRATAQETDAGAAGAADRRDFDIPAQSLTEALALFGRQSGLQVSVDADLVRDLSSPGVSGSFTPEQALARLLAGTGLDFGISAGTVTLARAPTQDGGGPIELGPIKVEGWRSTETRGYRPDLVSSATKTDSAIVDVPASVSVVTEDVIEDQNARSLAEVLRNVPGVEPGPNPANVSVQEEFTIRGFPNFLVNVNGVERRSTGPLSTANIESVEVLKGPFSVLYGQLSPGGFINVQTKRPERLAAYEVTGGISQATTGRGTTGRGAVDATGPITGDGSLLYRFIASADGGTSFIDEVETEQYLVNPTVSFIGLNDDLRVDVDFSYLRNDETFLFGVPARDGKIDTRIGFTDFLGSDENEKITEDTNAEVRAEYAITDATKVDAAFTYHLNEHFSSALRPFGPPGQAVAPDNTVRRSFSLRSFDTSDIEFEANGVHNFIIGPTDWRVLAGGDVRRTELEDVGPGSGNIVDFDRVNVLDPNNDVDLPSENDPRISFFPKSGRTIDSYGFYGQVETWIYDRVKLIGGVRYDNVDFDFNDQSGFSFRQEDDDVSPSAAALARVTPTTSVYGSYTTSFEQELSFNPDAEPFEPTEAEQWEAGVKQEFFDGGLLATVSVFQITQENLVVADPNDPTRSVQIGEVESRGVELEIKGQVSERLRVTAGYSFLDNEITKDPLGNEGNRLDNVPEHEASAFVLYDAYESEGERVTVGGGVFYTGERFTSTSNNTVLDDFVTVDITGQYAFATRGLNLEIQAGVKNLFDEEFFQGGFGVAPGGIAFRGDPRTIFARLTARF